MFSSHICTAPSKNGMVILQRIAKSVMELLWFSWTVSFCIRPDLKIETQFLFDPKTEKLHSTWLVYWNSKKKNERPEMLAFSHQCGATHPAVFSIAMWLFSRWYIPLTEENSAQQQMLFLRLLGLCLFVLAQSFGGGLAIALILLGERKKSLNR